jgi:hypothetical protein
VSSMNVIPMYPDRERLARLAAVLSARISRDPCGDPIIRGRIDKARFVENAVHADGQGWSIMASFETPRRWTAAKRKLMQFCALRRDGDAEGILHLAVLPTPAQARLLRKLLGVRKARVDKSATLARLTLRGRSRRFSAPLTAVNGHFPGLRQAHPSKGILSHPRAIRTAVTLKPPIYSRRGDDGVTTT